MISRRLQNALCALVLGAPSFAHAHIRLDTPKARATPNLKTAPCGASTAGTPQVIEGWTAGATVTIEYVETIDHPSHYRVALSREGDSAFVDPADADDKTTDGNELLDAIEDLDEGNNRAGSFEIVLPDEPCESCVLQFMQVMYDKPAMPFYYQCADVVIAPAETSGGSGGANAGVGGSEGVGGAGPTSGGAPSTDSGGTAALGSGGALPPASGGASSGSGGAADGVGGFISANGGTSAGVGGGESGDDGEAAAPGGGCSVGPNPDRGSVLSLLGLLLFGALGVRRIRARG